MKPERILSPKNFSFNSKHADNSAGFYHVGKDEQLQLSGKLVW